MHEWKKSKWRFYTNTIAVFVVLISIVLGVTGLLTYRKTLEVLSGEEIQAGLSALGRDISMIDSRIQEVDRIITNLSSDKNVIALMNTVHLAGRPEFYRFVALSEELPRYSVTNTLIYDFCIFFPRSESVVSTQRSSLRLEEYYGHYFNYEDISYSEWSRQYLGQHQRGVFLGSKGLNGNGTYRSVITYMRSLPIDLSRPSRALVSVLLDEAELHSLLQSANLSSHALFRISASQDEILSANFDKSLPVTPIASKSSIWTDHEMVRIQDQEYIRLTAGSQLTKWQFDLYLPTDFLYRKVSDIQAVYLISILAIIGAGALAAAWFVLKYNRPVTHMVEQYFINDSQEAPANHTPLALMQSSLSELVTGNDEMKAELARQQPLLNHALVDKLLRGQSTREEEGMLVKNGILGQPGCCHLIIVACLVGTGTDEYAKARFLLTIRQKLSDTGYVHIVDDQHWVAIVRETGKSDGSERVQLLEAIARDLKNQYKIDAVFAVGRRYEQASQISFSYQDALQALNCGLYPQGTHVSVYSASTIMLEDGYRYPLEVETQLFNLVISGNSEAVRRTLEDIFDQNFRFASTADANGLINELTGTINKLKPLCFPHGGGDVLDAGINHIKSVTSASDLKETVIGLFDVLSQQKNLRKRSHNDQLKECICTLINEQYHDDRLCLAMMADRFGISEKYLSAFFKEQTGIGFSQYVEQTRMKHAVDLLQEGVLTHEKIAHMVGYTTMTTFYRAFKRVYGVTPTQYVSTEKKTV